MVVATHAHAGDPTPDTDVCPVLQKYFLGGKYSLINNFKIIHTSVGVSIIIFILHHYVPGPTIELNDIYYQNVWAGLKICQICRDTAQ